MSGPAWELEIGTERLQDKENNVLGDDDEINQKKIINVARKEVQKNVSNLRSF